MAVLGICGLFVAVSPAKGQNEAERVAALGQHEVTRSYATVLDAAEDDLDALDAIGLGNDPKQYRELAERLRALDPDLRVDRLFQVDLDSATVTNPLDRDTDNDGLCDGLCSGKGEDKNYNGYMDRYLSYAIDICSTPDGKGNPGCAGVTPSTTPAYVWPGGCATIIPGLGSKVAEGCPPPQPFASTSPKTSDIDNTADIYIIQGGRIHLGGFGLGVGMKFSF